VLLSAAACDRGAGPPQAAPADAAGDVATSAPVQDDTPAAAPRPPRIYYDLTDFEWYAMGRPLVHDGHTYEVGRNAARIDMATLTLLGEYQGVDYYQRAREDADSVLYVPVFEEFWLPFVSSGATAPDTATTVPDPDPNRVSTPRGMASDASERSGSDPGDTSGQGDGGRRWRV
jgi:hypothetical protein